jgi:hypothetical protein
MTDRIIQTAFFTKKFGIGMIVESINCDICQGSDFLLVAKKELLNPRKSFLLNLCPSCAERVKNGTI